MRRSLVLLCAAAALGACPAFSQSMYKWVDEKGRTVFSETPPPAGVKGEKIEVRTQPAQKPAVENWKQREQEFRERRAKQGVDEEKARQADDANRERRCYDAKVKYDRMTRAGRVYRLDDKGERVYYTDDERAAQAEEAKRDMASYCR
jgi:Domain of unknown function (DUF4124)